MEHVFYAQSKGVRKKMTNVDQLISYILTLSPEQIEKAINLLPQVTEAIAELTQPVPPSENVQIQ